MLSEEQKKEFHTLGFLRLKNFLPVDEMRSYNDSFDDTMISANGGVRGTKHQNASRSYPSTATIPTFITDSWTTMIWSNSSKI